MNIVVCGGTGFIGRHLVPALIRNHHHVLMVSRDVEKSKKIFNLSVDHISWDDLDDISAAEYNAIINLSGANIAEKRWSEAYKSEIIESRTKATQKIAAWCLKYNANKTHIYNASAIGIYGLQPTAEKMSAPFTEETNLSLIKNSDFLSTVGHAWELAAKPAIDNNIPVTFLRFGVVLGRGEGVLRKLEMPNFLGLGAIIGTGYQAFSWIDIDDLVRAIIFLLDKPKITGAVNLCAPQCVNQKEFSKTLASCMSRRVFLRMPVFFIKFLLGQMGEELLLKGQNVFPKKLMDEGFNFLFPDLQQSLSHQFKS